MAEAFIVRRGGGAPLNYKIVGGTSAPSDPKENTIWVNTSTAITRHVFSATQPKNPAYGMVWISTGTASVVAFNALKKNSITVYPLYAKQYVSGAWVNKNAKSYQGGAWINWISDIVKNGVALVDFSGNLRIAGNMELTKGNGYLKFVSLQSRSCGPATVNKVNITPVKTIVLDVDIINAAKDYLSVGIFKAIGASTGQDIVSNVVAQKTTTGTGRVTLKCDVSSISGEYYVGVFSNNNSDSYNNTREYHIYHLLLEVA